MRGPLIKEFFCGFPKEIRISIGSRVKHNKLSFYKDYIQPKSMVFFIYINVPGYKISSNIYFKDKTKDIVVLYMDKTHICSEITAILEKKFPQHNKLLKTIVFIDRQKSKKNA